MKSNAPWSVKGIERDARETAKDAAKRQGMTVGEWLNHMIYSAGASDPTDGDIEGLKLRDLVTAIEHLNKRFADTDAVNNRNMGKLVERMQRLERVKPVAKAEVGGDVAERLTNLENARGDRERIETLKALEKAVAQIAVKFSTSQDASLARIEATEKELATLSAHAASGGGADASAAAFEKLQQSVDALAERIEKAEATASTAEAGKAAAAPASDAFVEQTGAKLRALGEEIKRSGDQIRTLEDSIDKLAGHIEAAERRSSEGVQKVADTIASLRSEFVNAGENNGSAEHRRADIEAVVADAMHETEQQLGSLQNAFNTMIARLEALDADIADAETVGGATDAARPMAAPVPAALPRADADDLDDIDRAIAEIEGEVDLDEIASDRERERDIVAEALSDLEAATPVEIGESREDGAATDNGPEGAHVAEEEIEDDFDFDIDDNEPLDDADAGDDFDDIDAASAAKSTLEQAATALEAETSALQTPDADLDAILSDLESTEEEASDDEPDEDSAPSLTAASTSADDDTPAQAAKKPRRRDLTPKQKAILAARARRKKMATSGDGDVEQGDAKRKADASPAVKALHATSAEPDEAIVTDDPDESDTEKTSLFAKLSGLLKPGRRNDDETDDSITGDLDLDTPDDNVRATLNNGKTGSGARPVTLALGAGIVLAGGALFFWAKDAMVKSPERSATATPPPVETRTPPTATPTATSNGAPAATASSAVEVPAAPTLNPRDLYAESINALNAATDETATTAAIEKLSEAAALGHPPAQLQLGELYKLGQGVDQDLGRARTWFRRAANGGNVLAMHRIGVMTARGDGGLADPGEAIGWFELAANRGLVDSQYNLGAIYHPNSEGGDTGLQDAGKAYYWYSLAVKNGDSQAAPLAANVAASLTAPQRQSIDNSVAGWEALSADPTANELIAAG